MNNKLTPTKVLLIDDSPDDREFYRRVLSRSKISTHEIFEADTGDIGVATAVAEEPHCILLDFNLPDMDGLQVIESLKEQWNGNIPPVIILTGAGNERVAVEAMKAGAREYMVKGQLTPAELQSAVLHAIENDGLQKELRLAYSELEKKNTRLREVTDTALRFVDDVAHEFRTPLAVIHEFTALINDGIGGPVTDRQKEFLQFTTSATRDLAQMVDDFLDSSRLKHRALRVDRKPHRIEDLFDHVRPTISSRALSKQITIHENVEQGLPFVFSDMEKAGRTLINLLVNAVKFSPVGSEIELFARTEGNNVLIGVTDQGPGIREDQIKTISQRFGQAEDGSPNKVKGFGLGLNIASELARLNLGHLRATSQQGEGSTFGFTLPNHDTVHIIEQYIAAAKAVDEKVTLTVLQVTPTAMDADIDQLRGNLASVCYPMDLILIGDQHSITLIGNTVEPSAWLARIESARDAALASAKEIEPFTVQWRGTWSDDAVERKLIPSVLTLIQGVRACA